MKDRFVRLIYRFLCAVGGERCTALIRRLAQLHGEESAKNLLGPRPFDARVVYEALRTQNGREDTSLLDEIVTIYGKRNIERIFGLPPNFFQSPRPGHFYSPYPDIALVSGKSDRFFGRLEHGALGVEEDTSNQLVLAAQIEPLLRDFAYTFSPDESIVSGTYSGHPLRYRCHKGNTTFHLDAVVLQAMIRHFQPSQIIEIGSGYSSAIMLDVREQQGWLNQKLTFIEPYAQSYFLPLLRKEDFESITIIEQPLWDVDEEVFDSLGAGDLLFIDSSHVAKIGSDVYHYIFNIFPRLNSGVLIHIHDITQNFEMAPIWFNKGQFWNEGAFLRAFLMYNRVFEVLFHSALLYAEFPDAPGIRVLREHASETFRQPNWGWTNSFYLRRK